MAGLSYQPVTFFQDDTPLHIINDLPKSGQVFELSQTHPLLIQHKPRFRNNFGLPVVIQVWQTGLHWPFQFTNRLRPAAKAENQEAATSIMGGFQQQQLREEKKILAKADGALSASDMDMLVLINRASIITAIIAYLYGCFSFSMPNGKVNTVVSFSVGTIFLCVNLFYRYKKLEAVKLYFSLVVPLWVMVDTICVGGNFSQSAAFLATTAMIYVLYEDRKTMQRVLVFIVLSMFTTGTLIVEYSGTLFPPIEQPLDEVIVMVVSVIWIFSILGKRDREKKQLIQNLEEKNRVLRATTEELERFTHIASHDLKSPLRNISSFLGLIERDMKRGDTTNFYQNLEFAKKGAQQMHYLIQGILEISNINQDIFNYRQTHSLQRLMEIAVTNLGVEIAEKNARVTFGELPDYHCNDVEFTLLFQNLIQNGIKYNQSQVPTVDITVKSTTDQLQLIFSDNGIGIEPRYHGYVFEHFKRLHTSEEYMGTGLGLPLCRKIAQKHDGDVLLESAPGKGSRFIVVLPTNC